MNRTRLRLFQCTDDIELLLELLAQDIDFIDPSHDLLEIVDLLLNLRILGPHIRQLSLKKHLERTHHEQDAREPNTAHRQLASYCSFAFGYANRK